MKKPLIFSRNQLFMLLAAATPQGARGSDYAESVKTSLVKKGLVVMALRKGFVASASSGFRERLVPVYRLTTLGVDTVLKLEQQRKEAANVQQA